MGAVRIRHSLREFATQPVILWILLGGKPKWLPLNFGFDDVMRTAPILSQLTAAFPPISSSCFLCVIAHSLASDLTVVPDGDLEA